MSKEFILIRDADNSYIPYMASLSYEKRRAYEKAQPQFWCYKDGAEESQSKWFKKLLSLDDYIIVTAELLTEESVEKDETLMLGFIIGRLIEAPEVYDPKGLTLMIDDFCVKTEDDWSFVGLKLIKDIKSRGQRKGASQVVVVCGVHDEPKREFLKTVGLNVVSEWYTGLI